MDYELGKFSRISTQGACNIKQGDHYVSLRFFSALADGLALDVIMDLLGGNVDGLFGVFRDNDRVQLKLRYSF